MNVETAGQLMRCDRSGRTPEASVEKALRLAESDVVLQRKLAEQREFDGKLTSVIRCIQPPENLRAKLGEITVAMPRRPRLGHHALLPVVCGVLVLAGIAVFFWMEHLREFPGRDAVERMIEAMAKEKAADFERVAAPAGQLGDWFYMRGFEGYAVPPEVATVPAVFARVLKSDGHPAAELASENHNMLVHVFRAADFGVELGADEPWRIFEHQGWAAALRRSGDQCVLLAFRGTEPEMTEFVKTLTK